MSDRDNNTEKEQKENPLYKSKIVEGFSEETKLSTTTYIQVHEECKQVSTTKSPTKFTYTESLKEIGGFKGQEPTIHGDWQHKGRTSDF